VPYKNAAQARAMHAKSARGEIAKKTIDEFDKATDFKHLPAGKVKHKGDPAPEKDKPASMKAEDGTFPFHNEPSDGGASGSHDDSEKALGGARAHFKDSGPKEQKSYYGARRRTT